MNNRFGFALKWILSFQMMVGAAIPSFAQPAATPAKVDNSQPAQDSEFYQLAMDIRSALRRAQAPLTGQYAAPSSSDLDSLEARLLAVSANLKTSFTQKFFHIELRDVEVSGDNGTSTTKKTTDEGLWNAQINLCLSLAEMLVETRYFVTGELNPKTWTRFDFRLPLNNFTALILLSGSSESVQLKQQQPGWNSVNMTIDQTKNDVVFSLNPERAMPMVSDQLGNTASSENARSYLEWTAYSGLYQDLAKLNQLQRRSADQLPEPSEIMQSQFPIAKGLKDFAKTDERKLIWDQRVRTLGNALMNIWDRMGTANLALLNPSLFHTLAPEKDAKQEAVDLEAAIDNEAQTSEVATPHILYLYSQTEAQSAEDWANLLADAIVETKLIRTRYAWVGVANISDATKNSNMAAIDKRAKELRDDPAFKKIVADEVQAVFEALSVERIFSKQRVLLNSALERKGQILQNIPETIDVQSWVDSRQGRFASLDPTDLVQGWVKKIAEKDSFAEAQKSFEAILAAYLTGFAVPAAAGPLDFTKLLQQEPLPLTDMATVLSSAHWDNDKVNELTKAPDSLKQALVQQSPGRMKDLSDFINIGKALKLDVANVQTLKDLNLSTGERNQYDEAYRRNKMLLFPVLSTQLQTFENSGEAVGQATTASPLWQRLKNGDDDGLISDHLAQLQSNVVADLGEIERSAPPPGRFTLAWNSASRWAGFSAAPKELDGISQKMLMLIYRGSLLAANISQTRHPLIGSYADMVGGLDRASQFTQGMVFLNEQANNIMYLAIGVTVLNWLSMVSKVGALQKGMFALYAWLEPVFGANLVRLQSAIMAAVVGQIGGIGYNLYAQSNNEDTLKQFYQTIAQVPDAGNEDQSIGMCSILGMCSVSSDDLYKQSLRVSGAKTQFLGTLVMLPVVLGVFWGLGRVANAIAKIAGSNVSSVTIQRDFAILGIDPEKGSLSTASLEQSLNVVEKRIANETEGLLGTAPGQAMAKKVAEQSLLNLQERIIPEEARRWRKYFTYLKPSLQAIGAGGDALKSIEIATSRVADPALPSSERLRLLRHLRHINSVIGPALARAKSDIFYRRILSEVLKQLGSNGSEVDSFIASESKFDAALHISALVKTSAGDVTVVEGVPSEIRELMRQMEQAGFYQTAGQANRQIQDEQLYRAFVRAITGGST